MEEDKSIIKEANIIRTNLLIHASQELSLLSSKQRIKINSHTFQELSSKFGKYIITEKNIISSSPNKQCSNSFFDSFEYTRSSSYTNSLIGYESPIDIHIKSKKVTFSQRKLGLPQKSTINHCNTLISTDQKTIQSMATKEMRLIAKSLKQCYYKQRALNESQYKDNKQQNLQHQIHQLQQDDAKLNKHYSELNVLKKKLRTETKKCLDRVCFSLNKKKQIVIQAKEDDDSKNCNKSVIMLQRCSNTVMPKRNHRKRLQKEQKEEKENINNYMNLTTREKNTNNINQICFDFE